MYGKSTVKYLPYFLPSLTADYADIADNVKIIAFDNSESADNENVKHIKNNYPEIEIMKAGENLGFGRAYNKTIKRAKELGSEYFLALNPDMILEKGAIAKMIEVLDSNKNLGSVYPKILKWDFENKKKTNIIDSRGVILKPGLKFINLGEGERDDNFIGNDILGPAGTAAMYRMSALEKVKKGGEYFDELIFMYKEDCDLAYRLFLTGFKSKCIHNAVMHHARSAGAGGESDIKIALNRKNKNKQVKKWSFLSQQIIFVKYWRLQNLKNKLAIIWYEFKMLIFILLFEQYLLKEFVNLWKIRSKIKYTKF